MYHTARDYRTGAVPAGPPTTAALVQTPMPSLYSARPPHALPMMLALGRTPPPGTPPGQPPPTTGRHVGVEAPRPVPGRQ